MISPERINAIHSLAKTELLKNKYPELSIEHWVTLNHFFNSSLWDEEDLARRRNAPDSEIATNKRNIDQFNQKRNDAIERIDEIILTSLSDTINESSRQNSETLGSMIDRLSIINLKIRAMVAQTIRTDVDGDHITQCTIKLKILNEQKSDLLDCYADLLDAIKKQKAHYKIYHQFKMYNDPKLNPAVYNESPSNN
jgi:hypothetical protein